MMTQVKRYFLLLIICMLLVFTLSCNLANLAADNETVESEAAQENGEDQADLQDDQEQLVGDDQPDNAGGEADAEVDADPGDDEAPPVIDLAARKEAMDLATKIETLPDLSNLPEDLRACLATDQLGTDLHMNGIRISIFDDYETGENIQTTCALTLKLINESNENLFIMYEALNYTEVVQYDGNDHVTVITSGPIAPGEHVYAGQNLEYYPQDPSQGLSLYFARGYAFFYDRPECQAFIEDKSLLYQVWEPLEYVCKEWLPQ